MDTNNSCSILPLDSEMQYIVPQILTHAYLLSASKHTKIRIQSWLARLEGIISNNIWRKNRNNYYKLLFIMLESKEISEPFTAMAPEDVPTLHRHQINCILTKLATRLKEKERQKENKENKSIKTDPFQLWNLLEFNCNKNISSINTLPKLKGLAIETTVKQNNFDSMVFEFLSPISETAHVRVSSNLSEGTLTTLQKCRDMLNNCNLSECNNTNQVLGEIGSNEQLTAKTAQREVKYFKKNRNKQSEEEGIIEANKQHLYSKIYSFLKRHESHLHEDSEYREVMKQLGDYLLPGEGPNETKQQQKQLQLREQRQDEGKKVKDEEDFSLVDIEEDSCDYLSGKYSEYSSIQVDSGISPSRIKILHSRQDEGGKNGLESYRRMVSQGTGGRKGLRLHQW